MNVQQLIEKYEKLEGVWNAEGAELARQFFLQDLQQLDEPEKVKVPPFVSVWYRINKDNLYKNIAYLCANWVKSTTDDTLFNWMSNTDNFIQILVNMHQFGYEVEKEKEKRYRVKLKRTSQYLRKDEAGTRFSSLFISDFTRNDIENLGFGWALDCPGIEIEEVE